MSERENAPGICIGVQVLIFTADTPEHHAISVVHGHVKKITQVAGLLILSFHNTVTIIAGFELILAPLPERQGVDGNAKTNNEDRNKTKLIHSSA
ncbi:MAG: hypothetical protein U5K69_04085 [Balneolaceae bacterium]|nr:hypothetical protein [Balneolaceae bacterium]